MKTSMKTTVKKSFIQVSLQQMNMQSLSRMAAFALSLVLMIGVLVPGLSFAQSSCDPNSSTFNPNDCEDNPAPLASPQDTPASANTGQSNPAPAVTGQNQPAPAAPKTGLPTQSAGNKAVGSVAPITGGIQNPLKVKSIVDLFYMIVKLLYSLSYAVIAIFLIISGFKFVAAQGNEEKLKDAKKTFYYTIVGAILLIGANVITEVVRNVINQFSVNKV